MARGERFERVAGALFQLQINTIVCNEIMGRLLPASVESMVQLRKRYGHSLKMSEPSSGFEEQNPTSSDFDAIANVALDRFKMSGKPLDLRIAENSQKLSTILQKRVVVERRQDNWWDQCVRHRWSTTGQSQVSPATKATSIGTDWSTKTFQPKLNPEEKLMLQKIWEVGTEEIVMQSAVHLDGDVVTRITEAYASRTDIHSIHNQCVRTSINVWRDVVEVVASFIRTAADYAFPRTRRG